MHYFNPLPLILLCLTLMACAPTLQQSVPASSEAPPTPPEKPISQAQANRVVALTSLSADIIGHLDASKLVGITGSRLFAQDPRFQGLPIVSQGRTPPNLEKITALKPDLVIGATGFHDRTLARLKELGINTLATQVGSWADLEQQTRDLAAAIAADPTPLLQRLQACKANAPTQSPSTLVLVSQQPILAPNKTSWAGDLLTQFNAQNVAADLQGESPTRGYITLSAERVLQANPDVMILVDTEPGVVEQLKSLPFWNQLKATQTQQVHVLDYYGMVNPGSIEKIEQTCTQLKQILAKSAG